MVSQPRWTKEFILYDTQAAFKDLMNSILYLSQKAEKQLVLMNSKVTGFLRKITNHTFCFCDIHIFYK